MSIPVSNKAVGHAVSIISNEALCRTRQDVELKGESMHNSLLKFDGIVSPHSAAGGPKDLRWPRVKSSGGGLCGSSLLNDSMEGAAREGEVIDLP